MKTRHHRVISSWIAILAIVLNALMPTVSMALEGGRGGGAANGSDWIEVCSVQGSTWVRLAADGSLLEQTGQKPKDAPVSVHGEHCLYCLTHAASFALPPVPALALSVWSQSAVQLLRHEPLALVSVAWRAPAARAPPFFPL